MLLSEVCEAPRKFNNTVAHSSDLFASGPSEHVFAALDWSFEMLENLVHASRGPLTMRLCSP